MSSCLTDYSCPVCYLKLKMSLTPEHIHRSGGAGRYICLCHSRCRPPWRHEPVPCRNRWVHVHLALQDLFTTTGTRAPSMAEHIYCHRKYIRHGSKNRNDTKHWTSEWISCIWVKSQMTHALSRPVFIATTLLQTCSVPPACVLQI